MDNFQEEAEKFGVSLNRPVSREIDIWGTAQTLIDDINYFCKINNVKPNDVGFEKQCEEYGYCKFMMCTSIPKTKEQIEKEIENKKEEVRKLLEKLKSKFGE